MKLTIEISSEEGIVLEHVEADMEDSPHPFDDIAAARWLIDIIERNVDCEDVTL